jgi:hypothetical protein
MDLSHGQIAVNNIACFSNILTWHPGGDFDNLIAPGYSSTLIYSQRHEKIAKKSRKFSVAARSRVLMIYNSKKLERARKTSRWLEYFEVHRS